MQRRVKLKFFVWNIVWHRERYRIFNNNVTYFVRLKSFHCFTVILAKTFFPARYMMLVYYIFCTLTRTLIHLSVNKVCYVTATENMLNYFTYVTCSGRPIRIDVTIFTSHGELPGPFCWIHYYNNAIQFFHRWGKFCTKRNLIRNFYIYRYVTGGGNLT